MRNTIMACLSLYCLLATAGGASSFTGSADKVPASNQHHDGMVLLRGGSFSMGSSDDSTSELARHEVKLLSFWIDCNDVTVADFSKFVQATGYVTDAERCGVSLVYPTSSPDPIVVPKANWKHPDGPNHAAARPQEPVCQVSWNDASAYAKWVGKRLLTEAEWEYAARGGLSGKVYPWGDTLTVGGRYMANTTGADDGYACRAPVQSFPPNGFGLYDMAGNVWQWCSDYYGKNYYQSSPRENPQGPPKNKLGHVSRGGSWCCGGSRCQGHRVATRNCGSTNSSTNNIGFRCATSN